MSWQKMGYIAVPAFLCGVSITLIMLLNNTTVMAPPISPCVYSMDTRCKDELYRGVRWEDYSDGAGCKGCKEGANKNVKDSLPDGKTEMTFVPLAEVPDVLHSLAEYSYEILNDGTRTPYNEQQAYRRKSNRGFRHP